MAYYDVVGGYSPTFWWKLDGDETDSADSLDSDAGTDPSWVNSIIPALDGVAECGDYNGTTSETQLPNSTLTNSAVTTQKTISLWFYADTLDGTGRVLWGEGGSQNGLSLHVKTGTLYFNVYESTTRDTLSASISTGTLYHVLAVMDATNGNMYLWVNGSLEDSKTGGLAISTTFSSHSAGTAIGGADSTLKDEAGSSMSGNFDGRIADVAYWGEETPLDGDAAAAIYAAGIGGVAVDELTGPLAIEVQVAGTLEVPANLSYRAKMAALDPTYRWLLDGDTTDSADSLDADGGAPTSYPASIVPAMAGALCGDFDGTDDEVDIPDAADINTAATTKKSISVWFKADSIDSTERLIWSEGDDTNGLIISVWDEPGWGATWYFVAYEGSNIDNIVVEFAAGTTTDLHHLLVTMDTAAGELNAWYDGTNHYSDIIPAIGASLAAHGGGVAIGGPGTTAPKNYSGDDVTGYFDGKIADVAYWTDTVLTADDAAAIYAAGLIPSVAAPLPLEIDLTGALTVPAASVPQLTGLLAVEVTAAGVLDVPTATIAEVTGPITLAVDLTATLNVPAASVPEVTGPIGLTVDLGGTLDVPTATVPEVTGPVALTISLGGSLSVPTATVPEATASLPLEVDLAAVLDVPTATVPEVTAALSIEVSLGGTLDVPTATVPTLTGPLALTVDVGATLDVPTPSVSAATSSLPVKVDLGATLDVPVSGIPTVTSSLAVVVDLAGTLNVPTATVPEATASLSIEVDAAGILDVPAATIATLSSALTVEVDLGGVLDVPVTGVPAVAGPLTLAVDLAGTLAAPTATVNDVTATLAVEITISGVITPRVDVITPQVADGALGTMTIDGAYGTMEADGAIAPQTVEGVT